MKKSLTASLIIFGVFMVYIFGAGLIDNLVGHKSVNSNQILNQNIVTNISPSLTLNMAEISKHNRQTDCWLLINGKVYDITSYFGSHPGGSGVMAATCGTDATNAYMTQDPYASSTGNRSAHSSKAQSLLTEYYLGDLNKL